VLRYDPRVLLLALLASGAALAGTPAGTIAGCPQSTLPLPGTAVVYVPSARKVVLRYVRAHPKHLKIAGARTNLVLLMRHWLPSGWVKSECGLRVWERSLVVGVHFPAMDPPHNPVGNCSDCAEIRYLLARTPRGWLVWGLF